MARFAHSRHGHRRGQGRYGARSGGPGVVALARSVNRAIVRDRYGIYSRAGIAPLPARPVLVPVDPYRPDGPQMAATWQARYTDGVARPNRADRRFAESKHQRKLARRNALEAAARAVSA